MDSRSRATSYSSLTNNSNSTLELDPAWRVVNLQDAPKTSPLKIRPPIFSQFTGINNSPSPGFVRRGTKPSQAPFQPVVKRSIMNENAFYAGKPNKLINPYKNLNSNNSELEILLKPTTFKKRKDRKRRKNRKTRRST